MPNFDSWLGNNWRLRPQETSRAAAAWKRIQDKPTEIIVRRDSVNQPAQTVRVEVNSTASEQRSANAQPGSYTATLFGVKGHPTVDDTDLQRGDLVVIDGNEYEVVSVVLTLGEVQAICEVMDG